MNAYQRETRASIEASKQLIGQDDGKRYWVNPRKGRNTGNLKVEESVQNNTRC